MITVKEAPGNKIIFEQTKKIIWWHQRYIKKTFHRMGAIHVAFVKRLIKMPPKTGRIYRFRGRPHQASAPGEPPANRSGRLMKGVKYKVTGYREMEFGDTVHYGRILEKGGEVIIKGKMRRVEPRPHLSVAVKRFSIQTAKELNKAMT